MQMRIVAVGRAKAGPERSLTEDYIARLSGLGRGIGFGPCDLIELDPRKANDTIILEKAGDTARLIVLDERGKTFGSAEFSNQLSAWRDADARPAAFLIGGADGHSKDIRARADLLLSFGKATWPHMLVRAMLAEQLYRAIAIAANHPYHREG